MSCSHAVAWRNRRIRFKDARTQLPRARNRNCNRSIEKGVGAAIYYHTPIHLMPYYQQFGKYFLANTERIAQQVFSLPVHPAVSMKDVRYVAESVKQTLKEASNAPR